MVRLNKPTFTGGDDPKEIHYQKMEYKDNREKTTQSPKPQYTQISLSHRRELTTKREENSLSSLCLLQLQKREKYGLQCFKFFSLSHLFTLGNTPFIRSNEVGGQEVRNLKELNCGPSKPRTSKSDLEKTQSRCSKREV